MRTALVISAAALAASLFGASASVAAESAQIAAGHKAFNYWCSTCHAPDAREGGRLLPGTASLAVKYGGQEPPALEQRRDLSAEFVKTVIRKGIVGMPFFRKTEVSDEERDAIAAYLAQNNK